MKHSTTLAEKQNKPLRLLFAGIFWLAIWQLAAMALGKEIFLPTPASVLRRLMELISTGSYWLTVACSFGRIIAGFLGALVLGGALAALAHRVSWCEVLLQPIIGVIKATPVMSFIILALIWISSSCLATFISFLMVLPIVYTNLLAGLRQVDAGLLEMAQVFRLRFGKRLRYIVLPLVMPYFCSASSVGLGICWKAGVAAEVIGLPANSIGEALYRSKITLDIPALFAWTVTIVLMSMLVEKLFLRLIGRMSKGGVPHGEA